MRRLLYLAALSMVVTLVLAPAAFGQAILGTNCSDVTFEQAQTILAIAPSDPNGLDADGDGVACEGNETTTTTTAAQYQYETPIAPTTPATESALPSTGGPALLLPAAGLLLATGLVGIKLVRRRS